jgi:transcriptional regulator of acetoin/glycerol metabolism
MGLFRASFKPIPPRSKVLSILTDLSSTVRFAPAALRTLLAHNWPGNLTELRAGVIAAAQRRSAGDITDGELGRLNDRAAAPALNATDTALRATLEDVLARHGGQQTGRRT